MGGALKAVQGVLNAVAPIASLIPGVGPFVMAAQAVMGVAGGVAEQAEKLAEGRREQARTDERLSPVMGFFDQLVGAK